MSDTVRLSVDAHPLLGLQAFVTRFSAPLGELASPPELAALLCAEPPDAPPVARDEAVRLAVRQLLRHGGFKPSGRSKPASEYLVKAAEKGALGPINLAVDACNAASLHGGLPVSVVDLDRTEGALRVGIAEAGARYVFNASGQEIDLGGLLCLFDGEGPCANAVKDSQRTKTGPGTRRTLSVIWGVAEHAEAGTRQCAWYRELLAAAGATTSDVAVEPA